MKLGPLPANRPHGACSEPNSFETQQENLDGQDGRKNRLAAGGRCVRRRHGGERPRAGNQDRARHVRLDRLRAAHAGRQGRHLQEERARRRDQDDSAEGPPPGAGLGRDPVRGHHGRDPRGVERQRRADRADLPDGQVLRRRRPGRAQRRQELRRPEGQGHRRQRAGHRAVLRPGLDAQQERHDDEGREAGLARAAARRAGLRGRPERRRDDLRALPLDRARQPGGRQDPRDHARLPDGDGHGRLRADLAQDQRQGGAGADQLVLRSHRDDQGRPGQVQRDHGRGRQADAASSSPSPRPTCAGRTRRPTRSSSPATSRPS